MKKVRTFSKRGFAIMGVDGVDSIDEKRATSEHLP
jgi:hypothetical protein